MTLALLVGGLAVGGLAGLLLSRHLARAGYRYPEEADLPSRRTGWVVPATAVGVALVAVGQMPDDAALGLLLAGFVPVLVGLAAIDLDTHRLPDRWVGPGVLAAATGLVVVALATGSSTPLTAGLLGAVCLGGFYLVTVVVGEFVGSGGGMGLGDAKLAVLLGLLLGSLTWAHLVVATVLAFLAAGAQGLFLVLRRGATRTSHLAFGPHMVLGAGVVTAAPGVLAVLGAGS